MKTLTHDGVTQPVSEWALDYGIPAKLIHERLRRGWTVGRAITEPMHVVPGQRLDEPKKRRALGRVLKHAGKELTIAQWAVDCGITYPTLLFRLREGWPLAKALTGPVRQSSERRRGVVSNFPAISGTGAGSTAQETSEINFLAEAHSQ